MHWWNFQSSTNVSLSNVALTVSEILNLRITMKYLQINVSFFKRRYKHGNRNGYWSFINVRLLIIFMLHGLI